MKHAGGIRALIVDDQVEMVRMLSDFIAERGYLARTAKSGKEAIALLASEPFDIVVADLRMSDGDGLEVLAASKRLAPERPVIIMTAYSAIDSAIESIRRGAYHYLTKPFKAEELVLLLDRAVEDFSARREARALRAAFRERHSLAGIVARSKNMLAIVDIVERVAGAAMPVLITGEPGTGKGLVARALHSESARTSAPFFRVNCAGPSETLIDVELFGGSSADGVFRRALGGTLFLDEIAELAIPLQAKLLQAIEAMPAAGTVRIVAATTRDLRAAVRAGRFLDGLRRSLDPITIEIPPLRHRRDDIPELAARFIAAARDRHPDSPVRRLSAAAIDRLRMHDWPGNVRELEDQVERIVMLGKSDEIGDHDLPLWPSEPSGKGIRFEGEVVSFRELRATYARWALDRCGGHKGHTAEALGVDGKTLAKWLSEDRAEDFDGPTSFSSEPR